jgi:hypothetical protein
MYPSSSRTPAVLLAAFAAFGLSFGASSPARAESTDAYGTGVARVSLIRGSVAVRRGDSATPVDAALNAPVLGGDYLTTGDGAQAEIQFDRGSAVRLDQDVQLRLTRLDGGNRQLQLAQGTIDLRLLRGPSGGAEIDTPSISVRPRQAGSYRLTVDADGDTQVTVRSGAADILTPQGTKSLLPGTTLSASGSADDPALSSGAALASDDFDRFNGERDAREQRALANAYVNGDVEGVDDLDQYGRWVSDGSYGNVWVPSAVAPGWAPYRYGSWVWEDYYGWTWVGAEPWGWAPYHYGNWYHSAAYGWSWYPGQFNAVPVWRPALVAFFSFGNGGWSFGNIGWVPLAPFEPYHPWWGSHYYNNVTTITNVTNNYYGPVGNGSGEIARYANARHGGATAIGAKRFTEGRFDKPRALGAAQLEHVAFARGPLPVVPTEANLRFTSAAPVAAQPMLRRPLVERSFAGNADPVVRTPFDQQRTALAGVTHLRAVPPAANAAPATKTTTNGAAVERAVTRPVPNLTNATKATYSTKTTNATNATVPGKPRVVPASDPWSRFDRARGGTAPATGTTSATSTTSKTMTTRTMTTMTVPVSGGHASGPPRQVERGSTPASAHSGTAGTTTTTTTTRTPSRSEATHASAVTHDASARVHAVTHAPN